LPQPHVYPFSFYLPEKRGHIYISNCTLKCKMIFKTFLNPPAPEKNQLMAKCPISCKSAVIPIKKLLLPKRKQESEKRLNLRKPLESLIFYSLLPTSPLADHCNISTSSGCLYKLVQILNIIFSLSDTRSSGRISQMNLYVLFCNHTFM